jgi:hypothetical protein
MKGIRGCEDVRLRCLEVVEVGMMRKWQTKDEGRWMKGDGLKAQGSR